jgi:N-acetylneuraminic acid mutarotase
MQKKSPLDSASVTLRAVVVLPVFAAACLIVARTLPAFLRSEALANPAQRTLTFAERVAYQRAIGDVYWHHRIWPKERSGPKPSLDAVMSQAQLENKVTDYLRKSQALEDYWQRPITAEQLQAEMDRMAKQTKQPEMLRELFEALGNDPFVIAECLAKPALVERLLPFGTLERLKWRSQTGDRIVHATGGLFLPIISDILSGCIDNSWTATSTTNAPTGRFDHTAVWTGAEMIIWGGEDQNFIPNNTGGRYTPSTDSWVPISIANAPDARVVHTAVWTGSEMIVWGGFDGNNNLNTGGRYNPATNSWIATATANAPASRGSHTAVWTGNEMIIWGGRSDAITYLTSGARYNPITNSWTATSTINAPGGRAFHTAVWTGTEMIIWGGYSYDGTNHYFNTGGRYDPGTNNWTATDIAGAPSERVDHTALWTGNEMIVWGGGDRFGYFDTGGIYDPNANAWSVTSTASAPSGRRLHSATWTGTEMIVWGGFDGSGFKLNTGGRYDPNTNNWTGTSTTNVPDARRAHTAVWTGSEMIAWGGELNGANVADTGGRYCAQSGPSPSPTPRPRPTSAARPTPPSHVTPVPPPPSPRPTPWPRP